VLSSKSGRIKFHTDWPSRGTFNAVSVDYSGIIKRFYQGVSFSHTL